MGSRGVGCGRREQVEAVHGTTRLGAVSGAWWREEPGLGAGAGWPKAGHASAATGAR